VLGNSCVLTSNFLCCFDSSSSKEGVVQRLSAPEGVGHDSPYQKKMNTIFYPARDYGICAGSGLGNTRPFFLFDKRM
jgi:hypothetical protein